MGTVPKNPLENSGQPRVRRLQTSMTDAPGAIPEVPSYVVVSFLNSSFSALLSSTSVEPKFKLPRSTQA